MHSRVAKSWVCAGLLGATFVVVTSACGEGVTEYFWVDAGNGAGGAGGDDADAGSDAAGEGADADAGPSCSEPPTCDGDCVDANPLGPGGIHVLLWTGDGAETPPACPEVAPVENFTGRGNFSVEDATCQACACGPSSGVCALSSSIIARASTCNGAPDAPTTETNAEDPWDGTCTTANSIPAGASCGGQPCASLTVGTLLVVQDACAPEPPIAAADFPIPQWGLSGRACGYSNKGCDDGMVCVASAPSGYQQCLAWPGERDCPADEYSKRIVLYETFADDRACTPCACGPPQTSACSSVTTFYADDACSALVAGVGAVSTKTTCVDLAPAGIAIGSKASTVPVYQPGTCAASGGELTGIAAPINPMTFCCLATPVPE